SQPASSLAAASLGRASRTRRLWPAAGIALLAALALGMALGIRAGETTPALYQQLTFARGYVHSARFAPDGKTVIYGAALEGRPVALFSTRTDGNESRPIDLPSADVAGIARNGEMALLLGRHHRG